MSACANMLCSLRPKRVFAFLGHSHYHNIMTMILYCIWSYNDRNNIKLVVVASYIMCVCVYSMIRYYDGRFIYFMGVAVFRQNRPCRLLSSPFIRYYIYFSIFHRNENFNFLVFIALWLL